MLDIKFILKHGSLTIYERELEHYLTRPGFSMSEL
jgi:hypothetical protein